MRINYIELKNYRRFEHVELELPDGIIGIVGNNGVGKSTLVESIAWTLFGNQKDIVRAGKDTIRKQDAKEGEPTVAKLEFTYAGDEYVVTREMSGRALSIQASLLINKEEVATGANEVSELIEKKLGMDYKSFFISVFAKQKDLAALSSLSPGDRRAKVLRMLGVDRLDKVLSEATNREKLKTEKVDTIRESLVDENGQPKRVALKKKADEKRSEGEVFGRDILRQKKESEEVKDQEAAMDKRAAETSARLKTLTELNKRAEAEKSHLASAKKDIERIGKSLCEAEEAKEKAAGLEGLNACIAEKKKRKEALTALKAAHENMIKITAELQELDEDILARRNEVEKDEEEIAKDKDLQKRIEEQKEQAEAIEKTISELKDEQAGIREKSRALKEGVSAEEKHLKEMEELGPDGICPTCDRQLGEHHGKLKGKLTSSISKTREELSRLESSQREIMNKLAAKNQEQDATKRRGEALSKKEKHLLQLEKGVEAGRKNLNALETRRKKLSEEIEKIASEKFDKKELESLVKDLEELSNKRDELLESAALAKKIPELKESLAKARAEVEKHGSALADIKVDPAEFELLESTSAEIEVKRKSLRAKGYEIHEAILANTKKAEAANSAVREAQKEIDSLKISEENLVKLEDDLAYAVKLSELMKSFRNSLVARIVPTLSQVASELLAQLTEGRYNSLTLDDAYEIYVEDGGVKYRLDRFSGGESDLANLCLRLAISKIIADRAGTQGINLLVLDEIFGSQDPSRKRKLMASFNALANQFRQILLITHTDDIREDLSSIIEVYIDEKGESRAKLAA
jgi:exonuclease SbcC